MRDRMEQVQRKGSLAENYASMNEQLMMRNQSEVGIISAADFE